MDNLNQSQNLTNTNEETATSWLNPNGAELNVNPPNPLSQTTLTQPFLIVDSSGIAPAARANTYYAPLSTGAITQSLSQLAGAALPQAPLSATATAPTYALRAGGTVKFNGNSDLDGNPADLSDDAFIYAEKGFSFNGNTILPVQRNSNGTPVTNPQGKQILLDKAVVVAPGYLLSSANGNGSQYANLLPPQVVAKQTLTVPNFADLQQQELARIPAGTPTVNFNVSQNIINNAAQWKLNFPVGGSSTQPKVVKVTGNLTIPTNVNLSNYILIVENGSVNFNGNSTLDNVVLIAKNGNINLGQAVSNNVSILASGSINQNNNAKFTGNNFLANGIGDINFNSNTQSVDPGDNLRIISAGNITFNGNATVRGSFATKGNFIANGNSDIYGSVVSLGDISFNGKATFTYAVTSDTIAPVIDAKLTNDTGVSNSDLLTKDVSINGKITDLSQIVEFKGGFDNAPTANYQNLLAKLQADGTFNFTRADLESIFGGVLPDGERTLYLTAKDKFGNTSAPFSFKFKSDTLLPQLTLTTPINTAPLLNNAKLIGTIDGTGSALTNINYRWDNITTQIAIAPNAQGIFNQSIDFTGITNGSHVLTISATDAAGNILTKTYNANVNLDRIAPILSAKLAQDTGNSNTDRLTFNPTISGTLVDSSRVVEFKGSFNGINYTNILPQRNTDGTFTLTKANLETIAGRSLTDGNYTLNLVAKDEFGNTSTPLNFTFTLDTTLPQLNLTAAIDIAPLQNNAKLVGTIDGTGSTLTNINYRWDNSTTQIAIAPNAQGVFNQNLDFTGITNGSHTITVSATDAAGNILTKTYNVNVNLDREAPIISAKLTNDTGSSNTDRLTFNPSITGTLTDRSNIVEFKASFNGISYVSILPQRNTDGTFTLSRTILETVAGGSLANGNYTLKLIAQDEFGNASVPFNFNFTLDSLLPQLNLTNAIDTAPLQNNAKLVGTIDGTGSALTNINYRWDNSTTQIAIAPNAQGVFNQNLDFTGITNGSHTITVFATDAAGNILTKTYNVNVNIDREAPILSAKLTNDTGVSSTDKITFNPSISGTLIDSSNVVEFKASLNGTNYVNVLPQRNPDGTFTLTKTDLETIAGGTLTDGNYTLNLITSDEFGNAAAPFNFTFTSDTTITSPQLGLATASDTGVSNSDLLTNNPRPTIIGTGTAGDTIELWEGTRSLGTATIDGTGKWQIQTPELIDGNHTFIARTTDAAGNSADSASLTIVIDTIAPLVTLSKDLTAAVLKYGSQLSGNVSDSSIATLSYQFDGGTPITTALAADGSFDTTFSFDGIADGAHNLNLIATDAAGNQITRTFGVTVARGDLLTIALLNDTGASNSDGITSDTHIRGQVADRRQISRLEFALDGDNYVDLTAAMQLDGSFRLLPAQLDSLAGGRLSLGTHALKVRGVLGDGTPVSTAVLNFTYQGDGGSAPGLRLSRNSDTGVLGDRVTSNGIVDLIATAAAGATLVLTESGVRSQKSEVADANGSVTFTGLSLALGSNNFTIVATDINGNVSSNNINILRTNPEDVILTWNQITLDAIRREQVPPPTASRLLAMVHTAMFDAVNALGGSGGSYDVYRVDATAIPDADAIAAAASAAAKILTTLYPNQQNFFNTALATSLNNGATAAAITAGQSVGNSVAANILAWRRQDGARTQVAYNPSPEIGKWQPDLPNFNGALLPQWANLTPFALQSGSQFRPDGAPDLTDAEYTEAFNETKTVGARDSQVRTAEQTEIALFWADGGGTYTPAGHWNEIASTAAATAGKSVLDNARMFAQLNLALADAGIAAWDAKYTYNTWRPITAIRAGDKDGNSDTSADPNWLPLIDTPPFPEYVSGHSTFSGAASTVLTRTFGADFNFTTGSVGLPDVSRSYTSFDAAAVEAGQSRVYGGIHFQFANQDGLELGRQIGNYVVDRLLLDRSQSPLQVNLTQDTAAFGNLNRDRITSNPALTGKINIDRTNSTLQIKDSSGNFVSINDAIDPNGNFQLNEAKLTSVLGTLTNKTYQLEFRLVDNSNQVLATTNFNFTLDRSTPTASINNLDRLTATGHISGTASDNNGSTSGRFKVGSGNWTSFSVAADGKFDRVINPQGLGAGSYQITVEIADLAGNVTSQVISATVDNSNNIYVSPSTNPGWGQLFANGFSLAEGNSLIAQNTLDVQLGGSGKRTLEFDLNASFDKTDPRSTGKDRLAVYLVDSNNNKIALDNNHSAGVPLFSLSETGAEIIPGLVKFDGNHVSIDVSRVAATQGKLVMQLLNLDGDSGSKIGINNFNNSIDPNGTPGNSLPNPTKVVTPGTSAILDNYRATNNAQLLLGNVSVDKNTGKYTAVMRVQNIGDAPLSRNLAILLADLPAGVTLNGSGIHPAGAPYLNFDTAIKSGGLAKGEISDGITVEINDPNLIAFNFKPVVLQGALDAPPDLSSLRNLTVKVGDKIDVALLGIGNLAIKTDTKLPTGQITGDNHLVFKPAPDQIGTYNFTLVVKNGASETLQDITLNVVADPVTTTRVSGVIADTNQAGLGGVLVELSGVQAVTDTQGKFTIVLPNGAAGDTLKIYGQRIQTGGITYPFIAEKMGLVLGHEIYQGVNNQIDRPIYLPLIDTLTGTTVNPSGTTVVTNPNLVGAQVTVAANSLFDKNGNAFTGILSITEVPPSLTPAALPENLHPDMVVTIQPGDMVFNTPALITLPNRAGYLPGLELDLWSINPNTGEFDNVGKGKVSADGTKVETISGGIRNSSWHFFAPAIDIEELKDYNQDKNIDGCVADFEGVSTNSGAVKEDLSLVTYSALDGIGGVTLHYDSLRANPNQIIHFGGKYSALTGVFGDNGGDVLTARVTISANGIEQTLPGTAIAGILDGQDQIWNLPASTGQGNPINAAIQADLSHLRSGQYDYEIMGGIQGYRNGGLVGATDIETGKILVVNERDSVFGAGWNVAGLEQLFINEDGSALLVDGNGSQKFFDAPAGGGVYQSPPGDYSTLQRTGSGFQRELKDGTVNIYDANGSMISSTDPDGNTIQHIYTNGKIQEIIDAVGLSTKFRYTGNRVTTIEDPAGKITTLNYDPQGNLVSVTHPNQSQNFYSYDTQHLLTNKIDVAGNGEEYDYDEFGRLDSIEFLADNTIVDINPTEVQGLFERRQTITDITQAPTLELLPPLPIATTVDRNGRVVKTTLTQQGRVLNRIDEVGLQEVKTYNSQNLVSSQTDGRGNTTNYEYDERGNVVRVTEQIEQSMINNNTDGNLFGTDIRIVNKALPGASNASAIGDINNDGINDIISTVDDNAYSILIGDANGNLNLKYAIPANALNSASIINQLELKDVDNDGDNDLIANLPYENDGGGDNSGFLFAATRTALQDPVLVYLNQGNGQFEDPTILPLVAISDGFITGDFNGDTKLDILVRSDIYSSQIYNVNPLTLYTGDGLGGWSRSPINIPGINTSSSFTGGLQMFAIDVDRDGRTEVVFNQPNKLTVYQYNTAGVWQAIDTYTTNFANSRTQMTTGDVNNDGLMDLVGIGSGEMNLFLGQQNGTFQIEQFNPFDSNFRTSDKLQIIDIDGDQKLDLAVFGRDSSSKQAVKFYTLNTAGDLTQLGNLTTVNSVNTINGINFNTTVDRFADINGDGRAELLLKAINPNTGSSEIGIISNRSVLSQTVTLTKSYTYDARFNQLTSETDELGRKTLYDLDSNTGNVLKTTRVVGQLDVTSGETDDVITSYTYTTKGQLDTVTDALGRIVDNDYDAFGHLTKVTTAKGTLDEAVMQYEYDAAGNKTADIDALERRTTYTYSRMNMLLQTTDALGGKTTYTYDRMGHQTSITDALGHVTRMTYDNRGRLSTIIDAAGNISTDTYDNNGNLLSITDKLGRTNRYEYEARNRLMATTAADGGVNRMRYDSTDNVIGSKDTLGNSTQQFYDSRNRLAREVDALGNETKYIYDVANQLTATVDAKGNRTEFTYDELGRQIAIKDALGNISRTEYDKLSNVTATVDALGNRSEFTYDALNRRVTIRDAKGGIDRTSYDKVGNVLTTIDVLNRTTSYGYDNLDRQISITDALSGTSTNIYNAVGNIIAATDVLGRTTSYGYDNLNRRISTTDALGQTQSLTYDKLGNVIATTDELGRTTTFAYDSRNRQISVTDILGRTTSTSYDKQGNVISRTDGNGNSVFSTYDANNRLIGTIDSLQQQNRIAYDAVGNIISTTDALGRITRYTYDAIDRRVAVTDANSNTINSIYDAVGNQISTTDALGQTTKFVYDELDRQVQIIDAKNGVTTTGYDAIGNILSLKDAVNNTTNYTYDALDRRLTDTNSLGQTRSYSYDAIGNVIATLDRNGRNRTYTYDELNRQTAENWLDAQNNRLRTFSYSYDAVGRLVTANDPSSQYAYTYDTVDRLTSVDNTGTAGVPAVKFNYTYDAANNLLSVTDTIDGLLKGTNAYTYDRLNRVTGLTQSGTGVATKRVDMGYDAVNNLASLTRYRDLAGTQLVAETIYSYDRQSRLTSIDHQRGATNINGYSYTYDADNRLIQTVSNDDTQDYTYDATNQLIAADYDIQADEAYSYDANGNRTNAGYQTGVNNQLLSDGKFNYLYDNEGNRTKRTEIATGKVTEYNWDYRNRLNSVVFKDAAGNTTKSIEYSYDVDNQRIGKKIDGQVTERYVIDRNQIALVFDGAGTQTHRYLYGTAVDQVLADETPTSMVWALADNQGTVRDLIDNSGSVVNHITYDSFGRVVSETNSSFDFRYGYTGREQDSETGLDYYRARYYDAGVGRFISEDPIGFGGGDSNLSRYVFNSPVDLIDPDGYRGVRSVDRPVDRPTYRNPSSLPSRPRSSGSGSNPNRPSNNPYIKLPVGYPDRQSDYNSCVSAPGDYCDPYQGTPLALPPILYNSSVRYSRDFEGPLFIPKKPKDFVESFGRDLNKVKKIKDPNATTCPAQSQCPDVTPIFYEMPKYGEHYNLVKAAVNTFGKPRILTVADRITSFYNRVNGNEKYNSRFGSANQYGANSTRKKPRRLSLSQWDEYPYAATAEGGFNAVFAAVDAKDNNAHGADFKKFLREKHNGKVLLPGCKFLVIVV